MNKLEAITQGIETFEVPEGEGYNVFTVVFTVYTDGSITLPESTDDEPSQDKYTRTQGSALRAYITYNNEHMKVHHGASLGMMSDEKSALFWAVIDALKSPGQRHKERIEAFVLEQHNQTIADCTPFVSWFDDVWEGHVQQWVTDGDCAQGDNLFEVQVTESYNNKFSYVSPQLSTWYVVAESPVLGTCTIIHARCERTKCKGFWGSSDDEEE